MLDDNFLLLNDFNPLKISEIISGNSKLRRLELNITQKELADRSGVSLGSVKRFENIHQISLKSLLSIAVVLNSTEEFLNLFTQKQYSSIDELRNKNKTKYRKRARK